MNYLKYFNQKEQLEFYTKAVNLGLWNAEKQAFLNYVDKSASILDIGCGTGRIAYGLYRLGYHNVSGVDFCKKEIEIARQITNKNIKYYVGDISRIKLPETYDTAIMGFNIIVMLPFYKRNRAIKNIYRHLNSNAILILSTDNRRKDSHYSELWAKTLEAWKKGNKDSRLRKFGEVIYKTDQGEMFFWHPTDEEFVEFVVNNGFIILDDYDINTKYKETDEVLQFAGDNHIWVCRKV